MPVSEPLTHLSHLARLTLILAVAIPVLAGLAGTLLPAFSWLPALGGDHLSLEAFRTVLAEPHISRSIVLSLWTGLASAFASVTLAACIMAGGYGTAGWRRLSRLLSPLLSVPHAAAAYGLMVLAMPSGFLARLVSPELTGWQTPPDVLLPGDPWGLALIAGLVAKETPFLLLLLAAAAGQADAARGLQITSALGYGRLAGFLHGLWPQLYRQIRFGVFAVLAYSATAVDTAMILGPGAPAPLSVQLVRWMNDADLSMRFTASAGAVIQLGLVLVLFAAWVALETITARFRRIFARQGWRFRSDHVASIVAKSAGWLLALSALGGLALLALWSVAGLWPFPEAWPQSLSTEGWMRALPGAAAPLAATFEIAFLSAFIATLLCVLTLASRTPIESADRLVHTALALPLIIPQTAFLFGLQVAALKAGIGYGIPALVLAHLVFVLPYVFLSLAPAWNALDPRYALAAAALGKSPLRILLRVEVPMLLRPILTAFAVGFAVSAGLYLPTLLISAGRVPTITTEAVALASGGNRRTIGIYAFLQAVIPFAGFLLAFAVPAWLFRNRAGMRTA